MCKVLRTLRHDASKTEMELLKEQGEEISFCHAVQFYKMIIERTPDETFGDTSSEATQNLVLQRREEAQAARDAVAEAERLAQLEEKNTDQ